MKRWQKLLIVCVAALVSAGSAAAADQYPSRNIRIVVSYSPGGTTDTLARLVGAKLSEAWGVTVIVDNRPGAAGGIGAEVVAKAKPDGYTLEMATAGNHAINPSLYKHLQYGTKDFAGVSLVALVPNILVVNNDLPVHSVKELIAYAKAHQGKLSYGGPGVGSTGNLSGELFKTMTSTQMTFIPYKGSSPTRQALMSGEVQVVFDNMPAYLPLVQAHKIRALAVTTAKRSSAAPDLPTVAEAGVPGYQASAWFGLVAPAGTPQPIRDKISAETAKILKMPDVITRFKQLGAEPSSSTPQKFDAFIEASLVKWRKVIKEAGVPTR